MKEKVKGDEDQLKLQLPSKIKNSNSQFRYFDDQKIFSWLDNRLLLVSVLYQQGSEYSWKEEEILIEGNCQIIDYNIFSSGRANVLVVFTETYVYYKELVFCANVSELLKFEIKDLKAIETGIIVRVGAWKRVEVLILNSSNQVYQIRVSFSGKHKIEVSQLEKLKEQKGVITRTLRNFGLINEKDKLIEKPFFLHLKDQIILFWVSGLWLFKEENGKLIRMVDFELTNKLKVWEHSFMAINKFIMNSLKILVVKSVGKIMVLVYLMRLSTNEGLSIYIIKGRSIRVSEKTIETIGDELLWEEIWNQSLLIKPDIHVKGVNLVFDIKIENTGFGCQHVKRFLIETNSSLDKISIDQKLNYKNSLFYLEERQYFLDEETLVTDSTDAVFLLSEERQEKLREKNFDRKLSSKNHKNDISISEKIDEADFEDKIEILFDDFCRESASDDYFINKSHELLSKRFKGRDQLSSALKRLIDKIINFQTRNSMICIEFPTEDNLSDTLLTEEGNDLLKSELNGKLWKLTTLRKFIDVSFKEFSMIDVFSVIEGYRISLRALIAIRTIELDRTNKLSQTEFLRAAITKSANEWTLPSNKSALRELFYSNPLSFQTLFKQINFLLEKRDKKEKSVLEQFSVNLWTSVLKVLLDNESKPVPPKMKRYSLFIAPNNNLIEHGFVFIENLSDNQFSKINTISFLIVFSKLIEENKEQWKAEESQLEVIRDSFIKGVIMLPEEAPKVMALGKRLINKNKQLQVNEQTFLRGIY